MASSLVFKVVVTPILVGLASSAGRRWGPAVSGWLVALPLTAGPVVFFLAIDHGPRFATSAALGSLAGGIAQPAFCLGYGWSARRLSWPPALMAGSIAFGAVAALMHGANLRVVPLFLAVVLVLAATLYLMPRTVAGAPLVPAPHWEIPMRMLTATVVLLSLTSAATVLGPTLSGILATLPVYAATLATFGHRLEGWQSAIQVLRGLLYGLFGFAVFFLTLAILISRTAIAPAFLAAAAVGLAVQGVALWAMRRAGPVA